MTTHLIILGLLVVSVYSFHHPHVSPNPSVISYLRGDTSNLPSLNLAKSDE